MALKTMSVAQLMKFKEQIEDVLTAKVSEQRRVLESELSKLDRLEGARRGKAASGRGGARGAVAPKYRNPENPSETWAGRGLKPRWLTAAIKGGKKPDDFLIPGAVTRAAAAKPPKTTRKARK